MEIDATDRKILYYLCQNARLSYITLAKNVGVSRESVKARIEKMGKSGVIRQLTTIFNHPYFGLKFYNLYLNFTRLDSEKARKLERYMKNQINAIWAKKALGKWDYALLLIIKDSMDLMEVISEMKKSLPGIINETEFEELIYEYKYTPTMKKFFEGVKIKPLTVKKEGSSFYSLLDKDITTISQYEDKKLGFDKKDADIMGVLSADCRTPLQEISRKVQLPLENTRYRMKKLCERGVIAAFWPSINYSLFGWQWYRVRMQTNAIGGEDNTRLRNYILNHPTIIWATRHVGKTDIHIDLWVRSNQELEDFLEEFNTKFDRLLIDYEILVMSDEPPYDNYTEKFYDVAK